MKSEKFKVYTIPVSLSDYKKKEEEEEQKFIS